MRTSLLLIPALFLVAILGGTYVLRKNPQHKEACVVDSCPFVITEEENGGIFEYRITTRFTFILDESAYPVSEFSVVCSPAHAMGSISNAPAVPAPQYAVRFEAVSPGECTVTDRDFSAKVRIVGSD